MTPSEPAIPAVRWDLVPRGPLPKGCSVHGSTAIHLTVHGTVYATGPSLTCRGGGYWVRAVVKVATDRGHGRWLYLTPVRPSAPQRDIAASQTSEESSCAAGVGVRAVASFVLTSSDGHQVRYKRVGSAAVCR